MSSPMATVDADAMPSLPGDEEPPGSAVAIETISLSSAATRGTFRRLPLLGEPSTEPAAEPAVLRRPKTDPRVRQFRRTFYRDVPDKLWNDRRRQISHRVRTLQQIERLLVLSPDERDALVRAGSKLPVGVTPY